jgi:preprotein translocase SecE subunit
MNLEVYKKGQGRLARRTAYVLGAALVAFGAYRFYATFNEIGRFVWVEKVPLVGEITLYNVLAFVVFGLGILCLHLFLNAEKRADLLIDTEQELRKVTWPSRSEVWSATRVVVIVTFLMGMVLYGFDFVLHWLLTNYVI